MFAILQWYTLTEVRYPKHKTSCKSTNTSPQTCKKKKQFYREMGKAKNMCFLTEGEHSGIPHSKVLKPISYSDGNKTK